MSEPLAPEPDESRFESLLEALDGAVRALESGELDLADALVRYERGVQLVGRCRSMLETAEQRVEELKGLDSEGNPVTAPVGGSPPPKSNSKPR